MNTPAPPPAATGSRASAFAALALLVPVPTLGVLIGGWWFPGLLIGSIGFFIAKAWLVCMPAFWHRFVNGQQWSMSPLRRGGLLTGALLGVAISATIIGTWLLLGEQLIDREMMRERIIEFGLDTPARYLLLALYWTTINSLVEEYVWRWFVVSELRKLVSGTVAIFASALFFTIHHVFATLVYFDLTMVLLAGLGVFIGGAVWSWCYVRFESIWPGYLSHAIVDAAIFGIGYSILFS